MSSIAKSAAKPVKERRLSDLIRLQAGHMLTFDDLAARADVTERHILRKVLRRKVIRNAACLKLPLTLAYFLFFVLSTRLHEDVTNVFFTESEIRRHVDDMFLEVATIDDLWSVFLGTGDDQFIQFFFNQVDPYGKPLTKGSGSDQFGSWGRVAKYNQIQGVVRFEQTRMSTGVYGKVPYDCQSTITCGLCEENVGFQRVALGTDLYNYSDQCHGARRLGGEPRRLALTSDPLRASLPKMTDVMEDRFRFLLTPAETQDEIRERLNYFREREWLDEGSQVVHITMNLLNAELGRPRLEKLKLVFYFPDGGGIRYERSLEAIFLETWPEPRFTSIFVDVVFVAILLFTMVASARKVRQAHHKHSLCEYILNPYHLWEWLTIVWGWFNVYGIYQLMVLAQDTTAALQEVRSFHWDHASQAYRDASDSLFDMTDAAVDFVGRQRWLLAMYAVALILRFFVSFGAQPKLALAVTTLKAVLTDMFHFLLVFVPTFMSYVIAGSLLFGRRIEGFVDVTSSMMTCFRIVIESEYDWRNLSAEFYISAAIWCWSFILLIVMVMLNTVLAIIFDMYKEVREGALSSEAVWETTWNLIVRVIFMRHWVADKEIENRLHDTLGSLVVSKKDLITEFPQMPRQQMELLFTQCKKDMTWEARKDLDKQSVVTLTGAIMHTIDKANKIATDINNEETDNPLRCWLEPQRGKGPSLSDLDENFLTVPVLPKGGRPPNLLAPPSALAEEERHKDVLQEDDDREQELLLKEEAQEEVHEVPQEEDAMPDWMKEIDQLMSSQTKFMAKATHHLEQMHWHLHDAQVAQLGKLRGGSMWDDGDQVL